MTNNKFIGVTIASHSVISDKVYQFLCNCVLTNSKDHYTFHLKLLLNCISKTVLEICVQFSVKIYLHFKSFCDDVLLKNLERKFKYSEVNYY